MDEPRIGATHLSGRCEFFRGAVFPIKDVFVFPLWLQSLYSQAELASTPQDLFQPWDGKTDIRAFLLRHFKQNLGADQAALPEPEETSAPSEVEDQAPDTKPPADAPEQKKEPKKYVKKFRLREAKEGRDTIVVRKTVPLPIAAP